MKAITSWQRTRSGLLTCFLCSVLLNTALKHAVIGVLAASRVRVHAKLHWPTFQANSHLSAEELPSACLTPIRLHEL